MEYYCVRFATPISAWKDEKLRRSGNCDTLYNIEIKKLIRDIGIKHGEPVEGEQGHDMLLIVRKSKDSEDQLLKQSIDWLGEVDPEFKVVALTRDVSFLKKETAEEFQKAILLFNVRWDLEHIEKTVPIITMTIDVK
jgi:hypothetical protein